MLRALQSEIGGAGPLEPLLRDPAVTDVLVNAPDEVWVDRGHGLERTHAVASPTMPPCARSPCAWPRRRVDGSTTRSRGWTPGCRNGVRLHAVLPPISPGGTCLSLRVPRRTVFTLGGAGRVRHASRPTAPGCCERLVRARRAFLVSGGTGTGKTTLLSALLSLVDPADRLLLVEDAGELAPDHPHVVRLEARPANVEGAGAVSLTDLVRQALRMRPDRVVVGEVRGAEVVDLLAALNTGHEGGCGTVHANSAVDVPARLEALAAGGRSGPRGAAQPARLRHPGGRAPGAARAGSAGSRRSASCDAGPDGLVVAEPAWTWDGQTREGSPGPGGGGPCATCSAEPTGRALLAPALLAGAAVARAARACPARRVPCDPPTATAVATRAHVGHAWPRTRGRAARAGRGPARRSPVRSPPCWACWPPRASLRGLRAPGRGGPPQAGAGTGRSRRWPCWLRSCGPAGRRRWRSRLRPIVAAGPLAERPDGCGRGGRASAPIRSTRCCAARPAQRRPGGASRAGRVLAGLRRHRELAGGRRRAAGREPAGRAGSAPGGRRRARRAAGDGAPCSRCCRSPGSPSPPAWAPARCTCCCTPPSAWAASLRGSASSCLGLWWTGATGRRRRGHPVTRRPSWRCSAAAAAPGRCWALPAPPPGCAGWSPAAPAAVGAPGCRRWSVRARACSAASRRWAVLGGLAGGLRRSVCWRSLGSERGAPARTPTRTRTRWSRATCRWPWTCWPPASPEVPSPSTRCRRRRPRRWALRRAPRRGRRPAGRRVPAGGGLGSAGQRPRPGWRGGPGDVPGRGRRRTGGRGRPAGR